jgi:Patatin-like phospholipase
MRQLFNGILYSFPVQLLILHFRKYQVLLGFWLLLFSVVNSGFMKTFGADALFFAPEYLGNVNFFGALIVGVAMGVFFMSWHITTFILHSKRCKFLATTSQPFLKYCINNSLLPLFFLTFYCTKLFIFNKYKELMEIKLILLVLLGLLCGLLLLFVISFGYFFGAEKTIKRTIDPIVANKDMFTTVFAPTTHLPIDTFGLKVKNYLSTGLRVKQVRNVSHYNPTFLDLIFKRHHIAAIGSIALAFLFLITVGFFLDYTFFRVPAAASILVFFAVFMAVIGALTYFLQSWSLLFVLCLILFLNVLYQHDIIDPRNKAYGLNYTNKEERPQYNKATLLQLSSLQNINNDKQNMLTILNNWKAKQKEEKPKLIFINVSGGGLRSATFVMNTLQKMDSATKGELMKHTFLISGASGGMLAATYYRELYRNKSTQIVFTPNYTENITKDLLNPVFSSMIARDIFAPAQKFSVGNYQYVKDRGYAFENQLSENTNGLLNKQLKDFTEDEKKANVPLLIFNSTISRDGRKMMISSQPLSFMMKPVLYATDTTVSPDAVDFTALFSKQNPQNIRLLTVLRMNATFPYVLPNVWLPTEPVIDVMDAGLRDNFGEETSLRFIENFSDWIKENTSGVLIIQLRDRPKDNWYRPFENSDISDVLIKPGTMLQHNWFKLQDYGVTQQYSYLHHQLDTALQQLTLMYIPEKEEQGAALNFHLTAREKRDIKASFYNTYNQHCLQKIKDGLGIK